MNYFEKLRTELSVVMIVSITCVVILMAFVFTYNVDKNINQSCDDLKQIYNTCNRLNSEILSTNDVNQINLKRIELNQMIQYYNIKCDERGRSWCKSNGVPYKIK